MNNLIFSALIIAVRQWRVAAIVYVIQLGLALTLVMQVYEVLDASIGHSLEIDKLMAQYDHTVLTDFLKVHGASITPLLGQLRWLLLLWLVFSVFIDGGLLYCAATPDIASARAFWQGGAAYFFPFLKIALFFLTLASLWTALLWLPVAVNLEASLERFPSEKYTVWLVLAVLALWLAGLATLFLWSVASRLQRLRAGVSAAGGLRAGWRVFRRNGARFWALLLAFVCLQAALTAVYLTVEAHTGMTVPALIPVFFLVQQAFVFFRIQVRQMVYAGLGQVK